MQRCRILSSHYAGVQYEKEKEKKKKKKERPLPKNTNSYYLVKNPA